MAMLLVVAHAEGCRHACSTVGVHMASPDRCVCLLPCRARSQRTCLQTCCSASLASCKGMTAFWCRWAATWHALLADLHGHMSQMWQTAATHPQQVPACGACTWFYGRRCLLFILLGPVQRWDGCDRVCRAMCLLTLPVLLLLLQAFLRAGCVHLTYEALQTQQQVQAGLPWEQLAAALGPDLLATRAVLLQQGKQATVLAPGGKAEATWAVEQSSGPAKLTAQLHSVEPCCVVAGQAADVMLTGSNLSTPGIKLHARFQGTFLEVGAVQQQRDGAQLVAMPAVPSPGRVALELEQQLLLSEPLQLLVVPEQQMAEEVQRLQHALAPQQAQQLLQDLGLMLDYSSVRSRQQGQWERREEHALHDSAGSQMSSSRDSSRRNSTETAAAAAELSQHGAEEQQEQEEEVEAAESSSCMSDDSAQHMSEEEEQELGSGEHPWLSARWARLVIRTGSRLLLLAAAHGCTATAGWLLELLEEVAPGSVDVAQVRGGCNQRTGLLCSWQVLGCIWCGAVMHDPLCPMPCRAVHRAVMLPGKVTVNHACSCCSVG